MEGQYDICIAGGGMAGASLACALAGAPARIALLEAVSWRSDDPPSYDDRGLALSLATQRVLRALGLWDALAAGGSPIRRIHVSEQGRFGRVCLDAADEGVDAFGYVVIARELGRVLVQRVEEAANVEVLCPARVTSVVSGANHVTVRSDTENGQRGIRCRLLVAADGAASAVRELLNIGVARHDYGQTAIVANVTPARDHRDTAYERFSACGPLALLPLAGGRCVSVCAVETGGHGRYLKMAEGDYLRYLEQRFGRRLGPFGRLGSRRAYPLTRVSANAQVGSRFVLLGNAAHTLHPNAAQGFNLAVRDTAALAGQLLTALQANRDPGGAAVLDAYVQARRGDQARVTRFTHGLASLFQGDDAPRRMLRRAGMLCTEFLPPLKHRLVRAGMGLSGPQPEWVRGGRLP